MEELTKIATLYFEIKEKLKDLTIEKKEVEKKMYELMEYHRITNVLLKNGNTIEYKYEKSLICKKDKKIIDN